MPEVLPRDQKRGGPGKQMAVADSHHASLRGLYDGTVVDAERELQSIKVLGEGLSGSTELAWYTPSGKSGYLVALKHLAPTALSEEDYCAYLQQFSMLTKLRSKYIIECIALHAGGESLANMQASTVAVVEHASGGSMRDYVHRAMARSRDKKGGRTYTYCDALRWALQSAKGLQYLHGQRPAPLLHGAISLDNVLLKAAGGNQPINLFAKLGDYSLMMLHRTVAKRQTDGGDDISAADDKREKTWNQRFAAREYGRDASVHGHSGNTLQTGGQACARLPYTAPEVLRGEGYTTKADVFALGTVMYEVLHTYTIAWAVAPDSSPADLHAFTEHVAQGYRPPIDPAIPPAMAALIRDCWQADPVLRPSMEVVVGKLGNIDRSCVMLELDAAISTRQGVACCTIS